MKRLLMLALVVVGCGETPAAMMMPDGAGGDTSTRPPPDPNVPLVCQPDSWPDCPDGVFAFTNYRPGMDRYFDDMKTCDKPFLCTVCQHIDIGSECNVARDSTFHGYCRAKMMTGTCDKPNMITETSYPVFCIDINDGFNQTCPGA